MAWISGLADKAENILNKLDQNAASALQVSSSSLTGGDDEGGETVLGTLRRNLSNSNLQVKSTFSPLKVRNVAKPAFSENENKEALNLQNTTDLPEPNVQMDWNINSEISSRRSSINSHADAVAIDVEDTNPKHDFMRKIATEGSLLSSTHESNELKAFKIALNEVTSERDDLKARLVAITRDNEKIVLKKKLQEMESLLQRLTDERDQAQNELRKAQTKQNSYIHSISELETNLAKLQQEYLEAAHKLQIQMKETEQQRKELQEYRVKAQYSLQMKDTLIAELKANRLTVGTNASNEDESDSHLSQMEFDNLKHDHQQTLEENNTLRIQLEELRRDWQLINEQLTEYQQNTRTTEEMLRKELRAERERLLSTESEQRVHAQELIKLRQQLSNQMAASATRLQEKETQLQQLQAELLRRKTSVNAQEGLAVDNLDERMKVLTQTLVDKQQAVERITSERNALRIQLEKLQDQLHKHYTFNSTLQIGNKTQPRNTLLSNTTDDVKAQFPLLLRENPFDNRVARRVKRVYSSLDSVGVRLGTFLRRYPLMRVFVLMYVGLLHLWVMFVLISSSPN